MKKYNCIIIEDEPIAAEILEDYIRQIPYLQLKTICTNAISALDVMQNGEIEVIFLDIHLPKLKGLDFLRTLKSPPQIIITSAYKEYALRAFELNVVDYLLKPIEFNRFLMAVNKLNQQSLKTAPPAISSFASGRTHLFFNVNKRRVKIYLDEILYIESFREYIRITTSDKNILTKFQLRQIEEVLVNNNFLRVHRSFIVAREKINAFNSSEMEVGGKNIPIGRSYKELVLRTLE